MTHHHNSIKKSLQNRPIQHHHVEAAAYSRRDMLKGMGGIMAAHIAVITDSWAVGVRTAPAQSDRVMSLLPETFPRPFGYRDRPSGRPPAGFFNPQHLAMIGQALPKERPWQQRWQQQWQQQWQRTWRQDSISEQLQRIHHWFNQAPYRPASVKQTLSPPRLTPLSFLRQGGDSEGHALMRYLALLHIGYHPQRLRITALALPPQRRATPRRLLHAVLCVYHEADITVLDHLYDAPYSHSHALGYCPLYMFNHDHRWVCHPPDRNEITSNDSPSNDMTEMMIL